jgi:hypothetical protein
VESDDPENAIGLGKVAFENTLQIRDLTSTPSVMVLFVELTHLHQNLDRSNNI